MYGLIKLSDYTNKVYELIKVLKIDNIVTNNITLIGWSMGGSISLELAERNLDGLKNIVLLNSSAKWKLDLTNFDTTIKFDLRPMFINGFTSLTPQSVKDIFTTNYDKYISDESACKTDILATYNYDKVSELSKVNVPVLAISGDMDMLALPEYQEILRGNIPNCQVKIYQDRGHQLFMEIPNEIEQDIRNFLNRRWL
jgi:pimeloyl-ACP methyl ester carboxylesterase